MASDDGFDEVPQVLKPPPPGKVVWAKLARYPWWPAEVNSVHATHELCLWLGLCASARHIWNYHAESVGHRKP